MWYDDTVLQLSQLCTLHNLPPLLLPLPTQLFTTSETGETFSILKTLFKSLAGAEPGCLACCCSCWCWCWLSSSPQPTRVLLRDWWKLWSINVLLDIWIYTVHTQLSNGANFVSKLKTKSNFQANFSDMIGNYCIMQAHAWSRYMGLVNI